MHFSCSYQKIRLRFRSPAQTSRGIYENKISWMLSLSDGESIGVGECSLLPGLSIDDRPDFENRLDEFCRQINSGFFPSEQELTEFPSIRFGIETALLDLHNGGKRILFPSEFISGKKSIPINGLIWMGDKQTMRRQITEKIDRGFSCLKLKIGALNWSDEREVLAEIRRQFRRKDLTIRVDANGAYTFQKATEVLSELAEMQVHSIEQPLPKGRWKEMARLCREAPLPIALDEELIGLFPRKKKEELLDTLHPPYLIIKPGLLGGFKEAEEWISLARERGIGWWATSALESNIGLNAIAQWTYMQNVTLHQGLGTGQLFTNNIDSPLALLGEHLYYLPQKEWGTYFPQETED
ncbi:MAG TPA: o-succinylbenzoate synthase [Prolixibacteraceae bacterium]|nr:o-succinylbenzoate synthase [Prolixibacteraceae bacterium]